MTGWIESSVLIDRVDEIIPATASGIEQVVPGWQLKEQTFRIYNVNQTDNKVTVNARARSYDLAYNLTTYEINTEVTLQAALDGILAGTLEATEAEAYTDIAGTRVGVHAKDLNPIEAMLDPEDGLCARWNAQMVRDEMDFYLLAHAGRNRGLRIEYARNLAGVHMSTNTEDVFTHIRPIGETKDGKPLHLTTEGGLVASPNAGNYPFMRIYPLKVSEAKVSDDVSTALARTRMELAAQNLIDQGIDQPKVDGKIAFERLGDTHRYAQYRQLRDVAFLYDTITVYHPVLGIDMQAQVCRLKWDCLREHTKDMDIGDLAKQVPSVSAWQLSGNISGSKLAAYSIGGTALRDDLINARHIQADSVNADAIQAESLTAETAVVQQLNAMSLQALTAKLNSVTAQTIVTDTLAASVANLMHVAAQDIEAGRISTDVLAAVLADLVTVQAKVGTFDLSTVQNLVSSALTLQRGQANSMYITNLAVTSANLLNVTVGKLVIKGDDGLYYEVGVGANGVIRTAQYDATAEEIAAGVTTDGRQIVEETINAQTITGKYVSAEEATFNRVLAAALEAGKITASEALLASASIPMLYVTSIKSLGDTIDISANESIRLQAGRLNSMALLDDEGLHVGRAVLDEDGNYQTDADGNPVFSTKEVLIREESVDIRQSGQTFSRFAGDYAQFGNYQMRKSTDGGLVFKMKEE